VSTIQDGRPVGASQDIFFEQLQDLRYCISNRARIEPKRPVKVEKVQQSTLKRFLTCQKELYPKETNGENNAQRRRRLSKVTIVEDNPFAIPKKTSATADNINDTSPQTRRPAAHPIERTDSLTTSFYKPNDTRKFPDAPLPSTYGGAEAEEDMAYLLSFENSFEFDAKPDNQANNSDYEIPAEKTTSFDSAISMSIDTKRGISHRLRKMCNESLIDFSIHAKLLDMPFWIRWCIYRAVIEFKSNIPTFEDTSSPETLYNGIGSWLMKTLPNGEFNKSALQPSARGRLNMVGVEKAAGSLLTFTPLGPSDDGICRLERHFGVDRFMTVKFILPSWTERGTLGCAQEDVFQDFLHDFLKREQNVLGDTFQLFHVEYERDGDEPSIRCRYFATSGRNIPSISLQALFDYAVPLAYNLNQPFCKAYARLELYLSKTEQVFEFQPSQIRLMNDVIADCTKEANCFDDPMMVFKMPEKPSVMNDGCSLISPAAALQICKFGELGEIRPSVFQGRINGAKGLWMIDGPYDHEAKDVWVNITRSQMKINPRPSDLLDQTFKPDTWTFELVDHSGALKSSSLYLDFLPILESRGVPRKTLMKVIEQQIQLDFDDLITALGKPEDLRRWFGKRIVSPKGDEEEVPWLGGLPCNEADKIALLLDAGFYTSNMSEVACSALNEMVFGRIQQWLQDMLTRLRIPLSRSTIAFGVADPKSILMPGEIYLAFSSPIVDSVTGKTFSHIEGDVLVARHPAMMTSDIQKVKAVYKPELSHLRDVVVFPSKGCIPLASKLQGGDYDGDRFWICFDPRLVEPFKNAPAPMPDTEQELFRYGIKQHSETLGDVLKWKDENSPCDFEAFLHKAIRFRLTTNLLGVVSNKHKSVAYTQRNIDTEATRLLTNLYSLVIDSAKNGYEYTTESFRQLLQDPCFPKTLAEPKYESALKNGLLLSSTECQRIARAQYGHVIDSIVFKCVLPKFLVMKKSVAKLLKISPRKQTDGEPPDSDLTKPYFDFVTLASTNPLAKANLDHLRSSLQPVVDQWNLSFRVSESWFDLEKKKTDYAPTVSKCYDLYRSILPLQAQTNISEIDRLTMLHLTYTSSQNESSLWDKVRASTLYHMRVQKKCRQRFTFLMAGRELAYLKSHAGSSPNVDRDVDGLIKGRALCRTRYVKGSMYSILAPRKVRKRVWKGRKTIVGCSIGDRDD